MTDHLILLELQKIHDALSKRNMKIHLKLE